MSGAFMQMGGGGAVMKNEWGIYMYFSKTELAQCPDNTTAAVHTAPMWCWNNASLGESRVQFAVSGL